MNGEEDIAVILDEAEEAEALVSLMDLESAVAEEETEEKEETLVQALDGETEGVKEEEEEKQEEAREFEDSGEVITLDELETGDEGEGYYVYAGYILFNTAADGKRYVIKQNDKDTVTSRYIQISTGIEVEIQIEDVNIGVSAGPAIDVMGSAVLHLVAEGDNALKTTGANYAGIQVPDTAAIEITGWGNISVASSTHGAGIGGAGSSSSGSSSGSITIKDNVTVEVATAASSYGAGIGGGGASGSGSSGGSSGEITISGNAYVNVSGNQRNYGAGIGGGGGAAGGGSSVKIIINENAKVFTGGSYGAGIGGGFGGSGDGGDSKELRVSGNADVTSELGIAYGGYLASGGAGIGGGGANSSWKGGAAGTIVIEGGKVTSRIIVLEQQ